jgi:hypothetical protein
MNKILKGLKLSIAVFTFLCAGGCYTYHVAPLKAPIATFTDNTKGKSTTYWGFFWGLKQPAIKPKNCNGNGLATVDVKTNYAYTALSFITLGIVNPIQINWQCTKCLNIQ